MLRRCRFLLLLVAPLAAFSAPRSADPAVTLEQGEIEGAKFSIARPAHWNSRLLLVAHGLRDADRPLVADLLPDQLAYRTLLDEGWIVAKTSYRRNGIIVADGIADLDALRDYIAQKDGPPDRVLLEGESMGGLIVTLIAERDLQADETSAHRRYDGAVAIGAALSIPEKGATVGVSLRPHLPLLFLTNQSELGGPAAYVSSKIPRAAEDARPLLFRVSRDGHVNVNQRERLAALRALNIWLDHGREALPSPPRGTPYLDVTVAPEPSPSQVAWHADRRGLDARVVAIDANYGNVFLNLQPADFAALGLPAQQWLDLAVRGQHFRVRYGSDFSSVKRGEWVVFPNADGFMWLARNFGDAAATAGLAPGDPVSLRLFDPADSSKP
jgi:pimeloyl-ACP methyl ester carboxylesterase